MFLILGEGSNGKGLIFDAVKEILGSYSVTIAAGALMATKFEADAERPTALSAMLAGAWFVVASESKEGQTPNAARFNAFPTMSASVDEDDESLMAAKR